MLYSLLVRWLITFVAVYVAVLLLPTGLQATDWTGIALFAVILALLNALVRPLVNFITCPITILTLGLFLFVVNGFMFVLASQLSGGAVTAVSFGWAILGALVVSIVSYVLNRVVA